MLASDPATEPCVSVVITCYNYACFLREAIESVLAQTFMDLEIIVVNDGSNDNTAAVARAYPVLLIQQGNMGVSSARNIGIAKSRGQYILPLDADDLIEPRFLEKTVSLLDQNRDVAVAYTDRRYFGDEERLWAAEEFELSTLQRRDFVNYCSLFRRGVWEQSGGYKSCMVWGAEDWDFWLTLAERGWLFLRVPEPLFLYRKHGRSLSSTMRSHWKDVMSLIWANHPALYSEA